MAGSTSPWLVAGISYLATTLVNPFLRRGLNWIRSFSGEFSGNYLSITGNPKIDENWLVEFVKCKHRKNKIYGKIYGIKNFYANKIDDGKSNNSGIYKFEGYVINRVLFLSYNSIKRGVFSSGNEALKVDQQGHSMIGKWTGTFEDALLTRNCIWRKLPNTIKFKIKQKDRIAEYARFAYRYYAGPDSLECEVKWDDGCW